MSKAKRFSRGNPFTDIGEAALWITEGKWVMWGEKPMHPGWMLSQRLWTIKQIIHRDHSGYAPLVRAVDAKVRQEVPA